MTKYCLLLVLLLPFFPLKSDVQKIWIKWNPDSCRNTCIPRLKQAIENIQGVKSLTLSSSAGTGEIEWDPRVSFSYIPFRYAMAAAGPSLLEIRLKVQGKIQHQGSIFYLISSQDNSRFVLLGPLRPQPGLFTMPFSLNNYLLSNTLKEQLLELEEEKAIVIIEGPLFQPGRYGLTLIIEQIGTLKLNDSSLRNANRN